MQPENEAESVICGLMSLDSVECSVVNLERPKAPVFGRHATWETFVDSGRARPDILHFSIPEARPAGRLGYLESCSDRFQVSDLLHTHGKQIMAKVHAAYRELIAECSKLNMPQIAGKLRLIKANSPASSEKKLTPEAPPVDPALLLTKSA